MGRHSAQGDEPDDEAALPAAAADVEADAASGRHSAGGTSAAAEDERHTQVIAVVHPDVVDRADHDAHVTAVIAPVSAGPPPEEPGERPAEVGSEQASEQASERKAEAKRAKAAERAAARAAKAEQKAAKAEQKAQRKAEAPAAKDAAGPGQGAASEPAGGATLDVADLPGMVVDESLTQRLPIIDEPEPEPEPVPVTGAAGEPAPAGSTPATGPSPAAKKQPGESNTQADLRMLRQDSWLRVQCLASVLVSFLLYTVVMVLLGLTDVYLLWIWIPIVLSGVLVGACLDLAHRRAAARTGQGASAPRSTLR